MNRHIVGPVFGALLGFAVATGFSELSLIEQGPQPTVAPLHNSVLVASLPPGNPAPGSDPKPANQPVENGINPFSAPAEAEDPDPFKKPAGQLKERADVKKFDKIEARELTIVDEKGNSRMKMHVDKTGVSRLEVGNGTAGSRAILSVFPDNRMAFLFQDSPGHNRLGFSLQDDGRPVFSMSDYANIILRDDRGRNRAVLRVSESGVPSLALYNEKGQAKSVVADGQ